MKYVDMLCNIKFLDIKLKYKYGFIDFFFFVFIVYYILRLLFLVVTV